MRITAFVLLDRWILLRLNNFMNDHSHRMFDHSIINVFFLFFIISLHGFNVINHYISNVKDCANHVILCVFNLAIRLTPIKVKFENIQLAVDG